MNIVGSVRHGNVAALRAYYSSEDEKFMLYDYYRSGSVYALLHGPTHATQARIDWKTRLKIAIGAARGVAEIHMKEGGTLVHGNIKASNVFLNDQQYGCVSDLGVTSLIRTRFMPAAHIYAPEVENIQNVSQASDVYSFGILLLELLTKKSPVRVLGGPKADDLVKLVDSAKNEELMATVFDADLVKLPSIREYMIKMLQIGKICVAKSPQERPKMSQVVKMLEDLWMMQLSLERRLVFDLEDMLSSLTEVLGEGSFGKSYKVILDNGTAIVVKRCKRENVKTVKEVDCHMDIVIGRLRHENVAELRAHYVLRDEVFLVYDYRNQESVSVLLHDSGLAKVTSPIRRSTLLLAMDCVARVPEHRPDMHQVVNMLEEIFGAFEFGEPSSVESRSEVEEIGGSLTRDKPKPSIESRLKDLLEDLLSISIFHQL